MESNEIKVYVKDKFLESLHNVKVFQKEIIESISEVSKARATVLALKKQNPDLGVDDIRPMLIDAQMKDYEIGLMEMDMKSNYVDKMVEYKTMSDIFKVDLGLSEEDAKYVEIIISQQAPMFVVVENKVKPKEQETHLVFMDKVRNKFSDEKVLEYVLKTLTFEEGKEDKKD
jgi:hypothetical protein